MVLKEAAKIFYPESQAYAGDIIDQSVILSLNELMKVFTSLKKEGITQDDIEKLSQTGIQGKIRPILSKLVQNSNQLTGKEIAENIGVLSNGISVMLLGNNEGDTHLLPFYLKADDLILAADGKGVAKGLGLVPNLLEDDFNTRYDSSNFFYELMNSSSNLTEDDTTKMNTLADYMLENLIDIRALVLGRDMFEWDWITSIYTPN